VSWLGGRHMAYKCRSSVLLQMVPTERLELSRLSPPPPQDGVSTNSTTSAYCAWDASYTLNGIPPRLLANSRRCSFRYVFGFRIRVGRGLVAKRCGNVGG